MEIYIECNHSTDPLTDYVIRERSLPGFFFLYCFDVEFNKAFNGLLGVFSNRCQSLFVNYLIPKHVDVA